MVATACRQLISTVGWLVGWLAGWLARRPNESNNERSCGGERRLVMRTARRKGRILHEMVEERRLCEGVRQRTTAKGDGNVRVDCTRGREREISMKRGTRRKGNSRETEGSRVRRGRM